MLVGHTSTGPGTAQRRNLVTQLWAYLDDILSRREGLKALLCDDTTRTILTLGYTQQQLLRHGVVLVDSLSNSQRFCMKHFSCVVLCRPSATSLASLFQELAEGNFSSYHLFLTSVVSAQLLQSLAEADVLNLVASVEEVFMDSAPITEWVGTTFLKPPALGASPILMNPIGAAHWDSSYIARMADSVVSMALSMNRRPVIRYRGGSTTAKLLAEQVATRMTTVHAAFPDLKASDAVLLILDRMDDPVTPLLMPWTYEAMIHELIGFQNGNEVMLDSEKNEDKPEDRVHVLTSYSDSFYEQHRYDDWGQVCIAVSEMVKTYKEMNNFDRQAVSLDEIRNFMGRFPEARKQSVQVTRHCGIASQMVAEINSRSLTKLSILEQDMIAHHNLSEHSRLVLEAVQDPTTDVDDALRIAMLYSLHYEGTSGHIIPQLKQELQRRQCSPDQVALIDRLLKYGGQQQRAHELFRSSTASSVFKSMAKAVGQFGKEVQNVLTQHTPLLQKLVNRTYNGSLDEERYPPQDVPGSPISTDTVPNLRPKDIFVVCLGGVTFSEARCIANVNAGLVDNDCERLMRLGKTVSRKLGGGSTTEAEPQTAKIEARVTLLSTAMISSKEFLRSLPPF